MRTKTTFKDLPVELKQEILRHRLIIHDKIHPRDHKKIVSSVDLCSLTQVSKEIQYLAMDIFYSENEFIAIGLPAILRVGEPRLPHRYPPYRIGHLVGHLELQLSVNTRYFETIDQMLSPSLARLAFAPGTQWHSLIERTTSPPASGCNRSTWSQWQRFFPALKTLRVKIQISHCLTEQRKAVIYQLPDHGVVHLTPLRLEIEVNHKPSRWGNCEAPNCHVACAETVKEVIEKMVHLRDS